LIRAEALAPNSCSHGQIENTLVGSYFESLEERTSLLGVRFSLNARAELHVSYTRRRRVHARARWMSSVTSIAHRRQSLAATHLRCDFAV